MERLSQTMLNRRLPAREVDAPDDKLIAELNGVLDERLGALIPDGTPVALLDFPNHGNVGDSLIWLGERRWLARHGCPVVYAVDQRSYSPRTLRRRVGTTGTVLLHGGGNFGDVWPTWQRFRERVISELPQHRVVQLPQSLHFRDPDAIRRARAVLGAHTDFHLLVRDEASMAFAREHFPDSTVATCPDIAFSIGPLARTAAADLRVLVLSRTDAERTRPGLAIAGGAGVLVADWTTEGRDAPGYSRSWDKLQYHSWRFGRRLGQPTPATMLALRLLQPLYDHLALDRAAFGRALLSRAEVIATDRLHVHILSMLLGVPHVVLDTGYGKLSGFHEAWTASSELAHFVDDPKQVPGRLSSLG